MEKTEQGFHRKRAIALGGLFFAGLVFGAWRCQFGVELYDEPFYLLPGFKLIPLGDRPLLDEFLNAPRHYDLLNYWLVRPLMSSFSVLNLRWLSLAVFAALILSLGAVSFRKRFGFTAVLLLFACIFFDPYGLWTWSHNWWARNGLLLHQTALLAVLCFPARRRELAFIAGLSSGLAAVAYNPMILVGLLVLGISWMYRRALRRGFLPYYLLGFLVPLVLDLTYTGQPEIRRNLWSAMKTMSALGSYQDNRSLGKMLTLLKSVILTKDFWLFVISGCLLVRSWQKKSPRSLADKCLLALGLGLIVLLLRRLGETDFFFITASTFLVSGAAVSMVLVTYLFRENEILGLVGVSSLVAMFCFGMASVNGAQSLFWAVPLGLIPGFALFQERVGVRKGILKGVLSSVLFLWALHLCSGSIRRQATTTYFDAAPSDCDTRLTEGPLAGLYTTETRARLIEMLSTAAQNKRFALSVGIPGLFYFSDVRSSLRSTLAHLTTFPPALSASLLSEIPKTKRFPELLVREKTLQWSWGLTPVVIERKASHPYDQFFACAAGKTIYSDADLEISSTDVVRTLNCLPESGSTREVVEN
jgi:hypothetical protein